MAADTVGAGKRGEVDDVTGHRRAFFPLPGTDNPSTRREALLCASLAALLCSGCTTGAPQTTTALKPAPTVRTAPRSASKPVARIAGRCPTLPQPSPAAVFLGKLPKGGKAETPVKSPATEAVRRLVPSLVRQIDETMRALVRGDLKDHARDLRGLVPPDLCPRRIEEVAVDPTWPHRKGEARAWVKLLYVAAGRELVVKFDIGYRPQGAVWRADDLLEKLYLPLRDVGIASWLEKHPEVLFIQDEPIGQTAADDADPDAGTERSVFLVLRHIRTTAGSTLCLIHSAGESEATNKTRTWCWREAQEIERVFAWGWRASTGEQAAASQKSKRKKGAKKARPGHELASGLVGLWPVAGRMEVRAVGFPAAQGAPAGRPPFKWSESTRPHWHPGSVEPRKLPRLKAPGTGWQPLATVPEPSLGALGGYAIRPAASATKGLSALDISEKEAGTPVAVCVRWQERWRCATPEHLVLRETDTVVVESVYLLPSRQSSPWIAVQRSRLYHLSWDEIDAGDRDFSEQGVTELELHRLAARRLEPIGSLQIGELSCRTHVAEQDDNTTITMGSKAYVYHAHGAAGEDCLRIGKTDTDKYGFERKRTGDKRWPRGLEGILGAPRGGWPSILRTPSPQRLPLKKGVFELPSAPTSAENEHHQITIVPLTGLWRVQPDGLVRVSADDKGSCPAPR